jgi:hypothetical protein
MKNISKLVLVGLGAELALAIVELVIAFTADEDDE